MPGQTSGKGTLASKSRSSSKTWARLCEIMRPEVGREGDTTFREHLAGNLSRLSARYVASHERLVRTRPDTYVTSITAPSSSSYSLFFVVSCCCFIFGARHRRRSSYPGPESPERSL
jgi:hypothetical protein